MTPPELRDLLADALALWDVPGRPAVAGGAVTLAAPDGSALRVLPAAPADHPIRWWVERPGQRRPCTSVLGLLRTLRNAMGAETAEARRLRVARPEA
ncbi:hypothetical protein [Paracraurococcus ruber]|uniref:Uncharacterized protein n=1 Tax=Paracraurococcus ruber TaxID=77675 RepID=A0ABS1CVC5_9PROT|nr:hypothetical protein [Paracraurococcus ruber]MBK1658466.1 hypothetical protein [Paracraurococcus ruber]TDG31232.1 hypothetical protein E2C05_11825 [Paracraurococcus ruber]